MKKKLQLSIVIFLFIIQSIGSFAAEIVYQHEYDAENNRTQTITPNGEMLKYSYDCLNRLEKVICPNDEFVSFQYNSSGHIKSVQNNFYQCQYFYDGFSKLREINHNNLYPINFNYDKAGRLVELVMPNKEKIFYKYDKNGRLASVEGWVEYFYNETGSLKKQTLANGISTEYLYDNENRLKKVTNIGADEKIISQYCYTYDEYGNCKRLEETDHNSSNRSIKYFYDKLSRLERVEYSNGDFEAYTYGKMGNRLTFETQAGQIKYEYDPLFRLRKAGNIQYEYDNNGNLIKKEGPGISVTFSYDHFNRLIKFEDGKNKISFEYDGEGNRVAKIVNGKRIRFINNTLSPISQVLLEIEESNDEKRIFIYGYSRICRVTDAGTSFLLYDHPARNVRQVVAESGKIESILNYDSFGNQMDCENAGMINYRYAGEQLDPETGLIYLRNRYYDPSIGRFISQDSNPGRLTQSQTLNPYPYVQNNPITRVDPLGNDYFNVHTYPPLSESWYSPGHAWFELVGEEGKIESFGAHGDGIHEDEHKEGYTNVISHSFEISSVTREKISNHIKHKVKNFNYNLAGNNCVCLVMEAMDIAEIPHPDFRGGSCISNPLLMRNYLKLLNDGLRFEDMKDLYECYEEDGFTPVGSYASLNNSHGSKKNHLSFGGVSFNKTAKLMLELEDIAGATFDETTQQVIFFGKKNIGLPKMNFDDLAVAFKSIYGLGGIQKQNPGVSIGVPADKPDMLKVRYDGQTVGTHFGLSMYESDRILKSLIMGIDNLTGKPIKCHVPHYKSLFQLEYDFFGKKQIPGIYQIWFSPDKIQLSLSPNKKSMIFDEVNIKLNGKKFTLENKVVKHPPIDDFVSHLNKNFNQFVKDFPILNELKRLGKITAVVKWIHDNQIPIDISLFEKYQVKRCHTPLLTPNINQTKQKGEQAFWMSGGVSYDLDDSNFFQTTQANAETMQNTMVKARPSEVAFEWDFESFDKKLNKNTTYKAVAHTFSKSQKDGNLKRQIIDMCFPVRGGLKLAFIRFYDSFNDCDNGLGRGWEITPFSLGFPSKKVLMQFNATGKQLECYPNIILRNGESQEEYRLHGLAKDFRPVYMSQDGSYQLMENSGGNFVLFRKSLGRLIFDKHGKLLKILNRRGITIEYLYDGARLIEIAHQDGRKINLQYNGESLVKAVGSGNKSIDFECNGMGLLISSTEGNSKTIYQYDSQQHLCSMIAPKGNILFQAEFDDYHRVKEINYGKGLSFKKEYILAKKRSKTINPDGRASIIQYDNNSRIVKQIDALGNSINFEYQEGLKFGKPKLITNKLGHVEENHYDKAGNISYRKNANGEEWHFLYDDDNQLIGVKNPTGWGEFYVYDQNKLTHCYHSANLMLDQHGKLTGQVEYYLDYVTRYNYDQLTGDLLSIIDAEGVEKKFFYDENGLPIRMEVSEGCIVENTYDKRSRLRKKQIGNCSYTYHYDQLDRLIKVITSSGEINYDYDSNGNIITIHDQKGNITTFDYNEQDNLIKVVDVEGGEIFYDYNEFGQLEKINYPNHLIQKIEYDPLNRVTRQIFKY